MSRLRLLEMQQCRLMEQSPPTAFAADIARRVRALERAVAALESARRQPETRACNVERQANARRLDDAIGAILMERADATGKECLRALERSAWCPLPSVRTVQRHMGALRQRQTPRGARETGARCQEL